MEQRQPRCKAGGTAKLPISPLVGEMSGRTEGGRRIAIASLPHDQPGIDMRCSCKGLKAGGTARPLCPAGHLPHEGRLAASLSSPELMAVRPIVM
ncbi:MAG: hypothetical protein E5Y59_07740 [Mesorhizobium sp.]|nr:MAG: hypothetical protein E5Y59_07740 [Mesorhizobium sp.]